jgi:hypothetical protein
LASTTLDAGRIGVRVFISGMFGKKMRLHRGAYLGCAAHSMGGTDAGFWSSTRSSTPVRIQENTLPGFPTAAIGRIERKRATARSELRRSLRTYWLDIKASRYKQRGFGLDDVVRFFEQYALSVFDAYAEECLGAATQPPQQFIQLLDHDLIPRVWSELQGDSGVWRAVVEESLDLSSFVFPHVPGRSIHKSDFLAPRRRDRIETALKQRIDEHWVNRAWDQLEHRARAEEANESRGTINASTDRGVVMPRADHPCERSLTRSQKQRLVDAEREVQDAFEAHENMREHVAPDGWPLEIRKLERDIKKYAITVLRVLADASWPLGSVDPFRDRLKIDARDIREQVLAKVDRRDLPFLDQISLETAVNEEVADCIRKAQREFPHPWMRASEVTQAAPALPETPIGEAPKSAATADAALSGMAANDPHPSVPPDSGSQAVEEAVECFSPSSDEARATGDTIPPERHPTGGQTTGHVSDADLGSATEHYPGGVSRSAWAKVKVIDAIFKTRLNQGVGRDQIVCESLQDCFDLLAKEILKRNDDLKDGVQRGVIQNTLLEIAVALAWLAPQMAPSNIAWAHREWLMRLLEGRIEYFESCLLGGTPGDIDKLGYVVIKVPETNPLFQSEDALEELNTQLSQPPKVFDIEALKLHASSAYGTQPEKVTPGQLEATIDAFMRKYRSIRVTGMPATLLGKGDGAPQPSDSKFVRAEPPVLESKPVGYAGRTVSPYRRVFEDLGVRFEEANGLNTASAQPNQDAVGETQAQQTDLPKMNDSPVPDSEQEEFKQPIFPRGLSGTGETSPVEPLVKVIDGPLTKPPARKGGRPVILVDGERIRELRGEYSQAAFALFCKVSVDAVQRAERHGRSSDKTIRRIVRKLQGQGHEIGVKDLIRNPPQ